MTHSLNNTRVAILATDGFEESELFEPKKALEQAGATVDIVSLKAGNIQGMKHAEKGQSIAVTTLLKEAKADNYDALVLPGGLLNPDTLRTDKSALAFTTAFFEQGKPVGAICHAPQILISANLVKGRQMTAVKAVQKDLENAGAQVLDQSVVVDQGLVTSRTPDDLKDFCAKLVEEFAEGRHRKQAQETKTAKAA